MLIFVWRYADFSLGHSGEVFVARFDPTGQHIASGSMDRNILLWHAAGECSNYGVLAGHKSAVLDLHWSQASGFEGMLDMKK